ncbi:MAG: ArsR family transcriptional regulator [Coriobacteriia bacterium]|nr:ArsR family transcriptional regulator [Coriobacteriia bacterium]
MESAENISQLQIAGQMETIFGSKTAACVLLFLESYGSGYGAQIAQTFSIPLNGVQQQLRKFEAEGILVSYTVGKTRVFKFNPRGTTVRNLRQFLAAELEFLKSETSSFPPEAYRKYFFQRQRPRRSDKPLDLVSERLRQ